MITYRIESDSFSSIALTDLKAFVEAAYGAGAEDGTHVQVEPSYRLICEWSE